jgi:hypothetical protein
MLTFGNRPVASTTGEDEDLYVTHGGAIIRQWNGRRGRPLTISRSPAVRQALEEKQRQVIGESVRERGAGIVSAMS